MSLHFELHVNGEPIGRQLIIQRVLPPEPDQDTICTYVCRIDNDAVLYVTHRYGDGPWILVAKALQAQKELGSKP